MCTAVKKWDVSDPRSYEHYWPSNWNETWKKIQDRTGFEPMTSAMLLQWFRRILSSNVLFTLVFILRFVS